MDVLLLKASTPLEKGGGGGDKRAMALRREGRVYWPAAAIIYRPDLGAAARGFSPRATTPLCSVPVGSPRFLPRRFCCFFNRTLSLFPCYAVGDVFYPLSLSSCGWR